MSIRMIVLTAADDSTKFRVAAHTVGGYWKLNHTGFTRVYAAGQSFEVKETVEELDGYFYIDPDFQPQPAVEDFESDEEVNHT